MRQLDRQGAARREFLRQHVANVSDTPAPQGEQATIAIEHEVLSGLCASSIPTDELNRAIQVLTAYTWLQPEHSTVFRAIQRVTKSPHTRLRDELPAMVTRMGFPDVDWARYFGAEGQHSDARDDMYELAAQLACTEH